VVRVCGRFQFVACCCNALVISEIRSRRPNRERPFYFFFSSLTFYFRGTGPAIFFCLILPASMVFLLKRFILSLFNLAFCSLLFPHCLMLRFVLLILSLFNVVLCVARFRKS
jgi:hypothetical protein